MKDLLRKILVMGIAALFVEAVGSALFRVNISVDAAGATIYVDDDNVAGPWDGTISHPYQNITSGLEHASYGDTVDVFSGTYMENVVVNKSVTLRGESKPVINGLGGIGINLTIYDNFVYGVTVDGFDITNCSYGIHLVMQNIAIDVTDLSITIGDIILNNNTISSNSDGIFVDINSVGNVMYGNSSVAIGDLRVANNVIKSSGKGINVDRFKYIGNDMFNNTAFSAGNIEITGNTVNSSQQGIYLYQIVALGETMYDDSRFTMGSILVNDNTVNSGDYGIAPWDIQLFGYGLYGNSSFTMSNIEFCRNIVNSTKDALGFSQFTGFGSHMYGNSSFSMGSVLVNDNTLYGDIWLTNFGNFGSYLNENSSCTMGNAEFCRNMIYINWVGGITFYGLGHFGYEMYNYSLFKMGDFPVNDNIIQCNSTRGGIDCTQSGGFGMNVYDNAVAIVGSFEFDGNDISSGWAGLSLYSLKAATVGNNAIRNCTYGIYLQDSVDNVIHSNSFYENGYSIYLQSSSNNVILENNITLSSNPGIYLYGSSSNVISGNTVKDSPNEHIELLYSSNNNIISGNTLTNSTADVGIYVYACSLNSFFGNNITANANSGIRIDTSSDSTIYKNNISENLADGVDLWSSSNITVSGNSITANNWWGINPAHSNNNTISGNNIKSNNCGINFASSDFNIVSANNITDNVCGIFLESSSNNTFHHNNLINNTEQAIVDEPGYANNWDDGYPSGGNYWSDYNGTDQYEGPSQNIAGKDTIGDTPYEINADNVDRYPLMTQYEPLRPLFLESEERWNMGEAASIEAGIEVRSVFASDVDDDGVVEIMTCAQVNQTGELRIYSYDGLVITLEHVEMWQTDGDTRGWSVFASDVDGDGVTEILVGAEAKGQVFGQLRIWNWNGTTLTLEHSEEWQTVSWTHVYSVFAADIDDDGVTEIITGGDAFNGTYYNNQLRIWNWNGTALTLESSREWSTGGGAGVQSVYALDVDGDSTVEIVTAGQDNSVAQLRIWNWNGTTLTLEHSEEWTLTWIARALSVFASDIDGDGNIEIVTGGEAHALFGSTWLGNGQLRVWNWNGSAITLKESREWPLNGAYAYVWTICSGDADRDGLAEIMTAGASADGAQLRVWSFNGPTLTLDASQESVDEWADAVFAFDVDGDGTIEIITAGVAYDETYIYEQLKIWSFPEPTSPTITIVSPENRTYSTSTVLLTFTIDEPTPWIGYSLDDQMNETITGNITLPTLLDGVHYVVVYANDTYGNIGMSIVYFTVDTAEPNITNVLQNPLTNILPDTVVKINATVTDATSEIKQVLLNCTFTNSTATWYTVFSMTHLTEDIWNATIPPNPYGTNVTYTIIAEDNAGNTITTEQIYGYKYEYPVVPEFPLPVAFFALVTATLLIAVAVKKKRRLLNRQTSTFYFSFDTKQ
jgi:parallel beta-helix repeat protein